MAAGGYIYLFTTEEGVFPPVHDEPSAVYAAQWHSVRHRIREGSMDVPKPLPWGQPVRIPKLENTFFNRYYYGDATMGLPDRWEVRVARQPEVRA